MGVKRSRVRVTQTGETMATYLFETITDAQASAFAASDQLLVLNAASSASRFTVVFNTVTPTPSNPNPPTTVTITDGVTGRVVTFGTGILGESVVVADGSTLFVGDTNGNAPAGT